MRLLTSLHSSDDRSAAVVAPDGRLIDVNSAFCEIVGHRRDG